MLTPLEVKYIIKESNRALRNNQIEIRYKDEEEWDFGHDTSSAEWTDYSTYWCSAKKINQTNIKQFPYGELKTGDLVLMIPKDTTLPTDKDTYQVRFENKVYTCKGIQEVEPIGVTFLYYLMVGGL